MYIFGLEMYIKEILIFSIGNLLKVEVMKVSPVYFAEKASPVL